MGNLGTLAMRRGNDRQTAAACLEQYLQLVQQLGDWQGEITAWSKMAQLAAEGSQRTEAEAGGGVAGGESTHTPRYREGICTYLPVHLIRSSLRYLAVGL